MSHGGDLVLADPKSDGGISVREGAGAFTESLQPLCDPPEPERAGPVPTERRLARWMDMDGGTSGGSDRRVVAVWAIGAVVDVTIRLLVAAA